MSLVPELQPASAERGEGRKIHVRAADEDADAFTGLGPINAAYDRLGDSRDPAPEPALRLNDRRVGEHGFATKACAMARLRAPTRSARCGDQRTRFPWERADPAGPLCARETGFEEAARLAGP